MEAQQLSPRFDRFGRERYMLIHKRPVGPKTAARLFSLYEELSQVQEPQEMYAAGWAIAEAGLVATHLSPEVRQRYIDTANGCWTYSLELEQERAARNARINAKTQSHIGEYRIATALASLSVFREIPYGKPQKTSVIKMHEDVLEIARHNANDMMEALEQYGSAGRTATHRGLGYEHLAQLAVSRMHSTRLIPSVSFARSEHGSYYPSQTHDVQYLNLSGGSIEFVTPMEVKSRLRNKFYWRYVDVGLIGGDSMVEKGELPLNDAIAAFEAERDGDATPAQLQTLNAMTETVIHAIRHHRRPDRYGRHCLGAMRCGIEIAS